MGVFTALVLIAGVTALVTSRVYAGILDNVGPNSTQFNNNSSFYELSNTPDVVSTGATIPIYMPHQTTSSIHVNVTCNAADGGQGVIRVGGTNICGPGIHNDFDIPAGAFSGPDGDTGYYEHDVSATITGGTSGNNWYAFKLEVGNGAPVTDEAIVGYSASNSSHFAIANVNRCDSGGDNSGCGKYFNYNLPFAEPCNTTSQRLTFTLFDEDNTGTGDQYNIQPKKFSIGMVQIAPNGTRSNIAVKLDSGKTGNNQTANYGFNFVQGDKYEVHLNGVYSNNVIQFRLPSDSINYLETCTDGAFVQAACSGLTGYIYDRFDTSAAIRYYIIVNPTAGDPNTTYPNAAELDSDLAGHVYVNGAVANKASPVTDKGKSGHGFSVGVPSGTTAGYNGPWQSNTYYLYAKSPTSPAIRRVDKRSVGACAPVNCGGNTFAAAVVGQTINFYVYMSSNNYGAAPPPDPNFSVTVTKPNGSSSSKTLGATWVNSTNQIRSATWSGYVIDQAGTYDVKWSYFGKNCGPGSGVKVGYAPYFNTVGGDISAGPGFGNGSCTENSADIKSWNDNTTITPHFFGAGSQVAAWATGNISNFVSGLGLSTNATPPVVSGFALPPSNGYGLSFANTVNNANPNYGGQFGSNSLNCMPDYYATSSTTSPTDTGQWHLNQGNFFNSSSGPFKATPGGVSNEVELGEGAADPAKSITIPAGHTITLYVKGNVYIDSNIVYAPYTLTTVPRFNLYVSGNIYINPNVTELHGVYIAQKNGASGGIITTCASSVTTTKETYGTCAKYPLNVIGAMAAEGQLRLDRTLGNLIADPSAAGVPGGSVPAAPAEDFQYTPELWLNTPSGSNTKLKAYTSLPPIL